MRINAPSVCALLLLVPSVALGGGTGARPSWAASFPPDRVASYLDGAPPRLIVVAAGERDAAPATNALIDALRKSKRTGVVMNQAALGQVAALDDEAIVAKAMRLPVEQVVVVRVFEGGDGAPDSAVVTFYDKKAKPMVAYTARQGEPLSAREGTGGGAAAGSGVAPAAASSVASVLRTDRPEGAASDEEAANARREYERKAVWFEDWAGINQYGQVVATWSLPFRGLQREDISGARFYEVIGRQDLADDYHGKQKLRLGLGIGGIALFAAGAGTMLWGVTSLASSASSDLIVQGETWARYADGPGAGKTPWIAGGALLAGGVILGMTALFINPNPVRADEARQMAIDYNRALRKRLKLPAIQESSRRRPALSDLLVVPSVGPGGAGVQLSFRF